MYAVVLALVLLASALLLRQRRHVGTPAPAEQKLAPVPLSVNYHFTRECQYSCKFCFHTAKSSYVAPVDEAKAVMLLLVRRGMRKINFSGGEPFIEPKWLGEMVRYCSEELRPEGLESVSIVSNGQRITEEWMKLHARHVDIIAVSCDSFDKKTCKRLGRSTAGEKRSQIEILKFVANLCRKYEVIVKVNTVITNMNVDEDMSAQIREVNPERWKVFQMLLVEGENHGEGVIYKRRRFDARTLLVDDRHFDDFCQRHGRELGDVVVPEPNTDMRASYFILDERLRFLDCSTGGKKPTAPLAKVTDDSEAVDAILRGAGFDQTAFERRGGKYAWSKNAAAQHGGKAGEAGGCDESGGDIEDLVDNRHA